MPMRFNTKLSPIFVYAALVCTATAASAERVWENLAIQLNSGGYIWATLDYESSCGYNLTVGSNDTNISGNASNCTQDSNGYWALHACGYQENGFHGAPEDVINEIIRRCN